MQIISHRSQKNKITLFDAARYIRLAFDKSQSVASLASAASAADAVDVVIVGLRLAVVDDVGDVGDVDTAGCDIGGN